MPATLNPYSYGVNNPILHSDPSGEIAPIIAAMLISGAVTGGIEMVSQLVQYSGNFHCLNWAQIGMAAGAGVVGGLFGFYGAALGVSLGGTGFLGAMIAGGFGGAAAGIGMRTTQTAISGDWSNWQGDIFNPAQVATNLAFGAAGGAVGYGISQISLSKFFSGDKFSEISNSKYLLRKSGDGGPAGFAAYDVKTGKAIYRVDLEGNSHFGLRPPHLHLAKWNIPPGGETVFNGWGRRLGKDVFSYNKIKAAVISIFIRNVKY